MRERLVVVTLAAVLPFVALSTWVVVREARADRELTQQQLRLAASLLAAGQDRAVEGAQQLLAAIASMPELASHGREHCQAYFEALRVRNAIYTNIGLLDPAGHVLCHAQGAVGEASAADRDYFREAVSQQRFVMGAPMFGHVSGRAALPFALPLLRDGQVIAVAFAAMDLQRAAEELTRVDLPSGARVLVADRDGNVLMEQPVEPGLTVPRRLDDAALLQAVREQGRGAGEREDASGERRLYAFASSRAVGDRGFVVRVGMPGPTPSRGADSSGAQVALALALLMLLAVGGTWWIGGRMIVKPAKQILGAVRRLEAGNLDARVPLYGGTHRGEFARIAGAFNLMAESLQLRQADLHAELRRSRAAYDMLDAVLNSMQEGLLAVTSDGQFLIANDALRRLLPLDDAPALPELWPAHFGFFQLDGRTPCAAEGLPMVRSALGESGGPEQVLVRNPLVPGGRIVSCTWQPMRRAGELAGGLVVFTDVTELQRLQMEQAAHMAQLKDTQRRLVEAQRIGRIGNWEFDLATGRLLWSDEVFELFGVKPGEFDGTLAAFMSHVHPDDRAKFKPARDGALVDGLPINLEYRIVRPDGRVVWMHEIGELRRGEDGEPRCLSGVVQDITQRKENERALQASQRELQDHNEMLRRAAEAAQAITSQATLDETLREVVAQARRVIGTSHAAVTLFGATVQVVGDAAPEGDRLEVPLASAPGVTTGRLSLWGKGEGEFTGRDHWVAVELAQLASIAIENARLFDQVRELNAHLESRITERTAELERQQQQYRALAEQAPQVVWNTDPSGATTFLNRRWYELVGGEPADSLGHGWLSRVHPDDVEAVRSNWAHARATLQPYVGTRRIRARDGSWHTMSYRGAPIVDDDGRVTGWVGIDADITELKAIEEALRTSNEELEAFSYSVSHDLRAPLGAIGGFGRALAGRMEAHLDDKSRHYLERVLAGVEKMEQLIEALLALSRVARAPLTWESVDLAAIARETCEALQFSEPGRQVEVVIASTLATHGDARLLRVLMENLLGNAWKFSAHSRPARIEVGRGEDGAFFVRDNGVGFDMAHAGKLFTAFQRLHTDRDFPGTGIGLASVQRIVARHQGRVWVESAPGEGTTFRFVLSEAAPGSRLSA